MVSHPDSVRIGQSGRTGNRGVTVVGKSKYTMKIMTQLTNRNKIKIKIRNIKYKGKGQGREGTNRANAFSYGLRTIS